jgi:hypothetical protein
MQLPSIRRLAAVDMFGAHGTTVRRRVISVEFLLGATIGTGLGVFVASSATTIGGLLFGLWIAGSCLNYVPLTLYALRFSPARLDSELEHANIPQELRYYTKAQFWIAIPLIFVALALAQHRT